MTNQTALRLWRRAATLAIEGAYRLPYLTLLTLSLAQAVYPPPALHEYTVAARLLLTTLLYSSIMAPLRLWRVAWYSRLTRTPSQLPSLQLPRHLWRAIGWRWHLWWRRALATLIGGLPASILWSFGSTARVRENGAAPLIWLLLGQIALLTGTVGAALWQCRYVLAPFYLLTGEAPDAAMALSARTMRGKRCAYINFIGSELPRLLLCLLVIPALWVVPAFRRRRYTLLLSWVKPTQ